MIVLVIILRGSYKWAFIITISLLMLAGSRYLRYVQFGNVCMNLNSCFIIIIIFGARAFRWLGENINK